MQTLFYVFMIYIIIVPFGFAWVIGYMAARKAVPLWVAILITLLVCAVYLEAWAHISGRFPW